VDRQSTAGIDNAARTRRLAALVAALIGGYLLVVAADPGTEAGPAFFGLIAGTILLLITLFFFQRAYRPGIDEVSEDEIGRAGEWKVARFLRRARDAAPFYLGVRLFLAYEWIHAGWGKVRNDAWMDGGSALRASWERAVAVPEPPATPRIVYPAYRSLIQFMLDNDWYTWFAKAIAVGELLIGIGLLVGGLTAIAAFFALLLNFSFIYLGATSSNPTMIILSALIIFGWRTAGWWGLDRFLLPLLGTPWGRLERPATARVAEAPPRA
jgi:thiosulfate dehydrogenase [quinone] large subunit